MLDGVQIDQQEQHVEEEAGDDNINHADVLNLDQPAPPTADAEERPLTESELVRPTTATSDVFDGGDDNRLEKKSTIEELFNLYASSCEDFSSSPDPVSWFRRQGCDRHTIRHREKKKEKKKEREREREREREGERERE